MGAVAPRRQTAAFTICSMCARRAFRPARPSRQLGAALRANGCCCQILRAQCGGCIGRLSALRALGPASCCTRHEGLRRAGFGPSPRLVRTAATRPNLGRSRSPAARPGSCRSPRSDRKPRKRGRTFLATGRNVGSRPFAMVEVSRGVETVRRAAAGRRAQAARLKSLDEGSPATEVLSLSSGRTRSGRRSPSPAEHVPGQTDLW